MWRALPRVAALLVLAALAARLAGWAGLPLAWMIGPMLVAMGFGVSGIDVPIPRQTRATGQTIVATAVGLQLSRDSVFAVSGFLFEMLVITGGSALLAIGLAPLLYRLSSIDKASAFFACVPCGPAEMAQLAEQGGGNPALVGLVQGLRIAIVVMVVPIGLQLAGVPILAPVSRARDLFAIDVLTAPTLLLAVIAGQLFRRMRIVSPYFLGPLALASVMAMGVNAPVEWPRALTFGGQLLLGISIGLSFRRDLLRSASRFVGASALVTLLTIAGCSALAWAIAIVDALPVATLVLAAAPGSVTEMSLTAQAMGLNVALVTTFHIVRLFIIMPLSPLALRFLRPL
ncbi:MAG: AbrB family transcriptional regulator [Rhodobacter sp.]|nr:AbrB family transcriptional regulator [Paracoccaceae bacterium]MCC0077270.1 AbrB family transcriptional regulator [Rhodobacter sp.]